MAEAYVTLAEAAELEGVKYKTMAHSTLADACTYDYKEKNERYQ